MKLFPFNKYSQDGKVKSIGIKYHSPTGEMPVTWSGKPAIWIAWPGEDPVPEYLLQCLATVYKYNDQDFKIVVITPGNIADYISPHRAFEFLSYVHRADYLRLALLHQYGGIYLDMDTICLKSLLKIYGYLDNYDIVNYDGRLWGEIFGVSVFGPTRRESALTYAWMDRLHQVLEEKHMELEEHRRKNPDLREDCLSWTEIMSSIVTPLSRQMAHEGRLSAKILECQWAHFAWGGPEYNSLMLQQDLEIPDTELLILNHNKYPRELKRMTRNDIMASGLGLCRMLRKVLND